MSGDTPAFPTMHETEFRDGRHGLYLRSPGITIRDYFAAQALSGLLAMHADPNIDHQPNDETLAEQAYEFADAMLAAREKKGGAS